MLPSVRSRASPPWAFPNLPKNDELGLLVNNLLVRAKKVKIPWTYYGLEEGGEEASHARSTERKENDLPHSQSAERKEDDVAMTGVNETKNATPAIDLINYETVVVKKITPNPDKVKKKKKKKKKL